ncbi:hypothetical protein niasHT_005853 [Heterodera trifolii]|uniref:Uncharacterized protein n=1 Tax=Heterodera trifolii TaxID=157864 RepID=A0ABD2MDV8_9BILA
MDSELSAKVQQQAQMCRFLRSHVSDLKNLSLNYSARLELLEKWAGNEQYSPYPSNTPSPVSPAVLHETLEMIQQQSRQHEQLANRVLDKGNTELAVVQVAVSSLKRAMTRSPNTDQTSSSSSSSSSLKRRRLMSEEQNEAASLAMAAFTHLQNHIAEKGQLLESRVKKLEDGAAESVEVQVDKMRREMEQNLRQEMMEREQRIDQKWSVLLLKEREKTQQIATQASEVIGHLMENGEKEGKENKQEGEKLIVRVFPYFFVPQVLYPNHCKR